MEQINRKEKMQLAWKEAKPTAKFAVIGGFFMVVVIFSTIVSAILPESKNKDIQEPPPATPTISSGASQATGKDNPNSIIQDTTTIQGKVIAAAERQRVIAEANRGKSAILPFEADESDDAISPYSRIGGEVKSSEPPVKVAPQYSLKEAKATVAKQKVSPAAVGGPLSEEVVAALQAPIENPVTNSKAKAPGSADIYSRKEVSQDPLAGMSQEEYAKKLNERVKSIEDKIKGASKVYLTEREKMSGGIKAYASNDDQQATQNSDKSASKRAGSALIANSETNGGGSQELQEILLQPGDYIVAEVRYPVDSRITTEFVVYGVEEPFNDARILCKPKDLGDFIVPVCTQMAMGKQMIKISATAINPRTMGGIVEQDVDNDTLLKNLALVGSTLLTTYGPNKLKSGEKVTENAQTGTVRTENTLSDRDIFIASLTQSMGSVAKNAADYYSKDAVKTIPAGATLMLVLNSPVPDVWGITKGENRVIK